MDAVFLKLLNLSITASWPILAVVVIRFTLKKAPKWVSCALWVLVGLRLLLPFSFESVFSLIPSAQTVSPDIIYAQTPGITSGIPAVNSAVNPIISGSFAPEVGASVNPLQIWTAVGSYVWLIGVAAMLIYAAVSFLRLRKKVSASLHVHDNIWICDDIKTPFILGVIKPRIYLPSGMADATQAHVLAHENAHLMRRDHLWKPLGFALLAVYWFNPLCWLAYILLCRDIELACDEKVIRSMEKPDVIAYSEALLSCSVPRRMVMVCPLAFGEVGVKERIKTVLNYKKPAFWIVVVAVVACVVVAVCFLTNPKSEPSEPHSYCEGLFMPCSDGNKLILIVEQGPVEMNASDDSVHFDGLTVGDKIRIEINVIQETYPGRAMVYGVEKISDGAYNDIDTNVLAQLAEMGWQVLDGKNLLSLNDVLTLSGKGEALTWSDFDAYAYTETGSGLYIRVYEIDERFSLWIGGGPTDEPPMYIRLVSEVNQDEYIDIRTEDVKAFITAHGSSVSTVGGAGTPDTVTETASDPLDAAVSAAILEHSGSDDPDGLFHCESHVTLATVSATPKVGADTHEVIVYAMVLYQEYNIANGGIQETSGSHIPTALSFEVDADGTHTLTEYWTPRDGSYYAPDIRDKFPADIAEDALDTQEYILAQKQSCYAQAVEYGKVDTDAIVEGLLDIITSSPATSPNPGEYIDAHPIEYRELTYYGYYTLRYVFGEFLKGGQTDLRGHIMMFVCETILPALGEKKEPLENVILTGQDWFDGFRSYADVLKRNNSPEDLEKYYPATFFLLQMIG